MHDDVAEPAATPVTAGGLAARICTRVVAHLEDLVERHLPRWRVPGTFAGHRVGPDVCADLAFTLAHLHDAGVAEVAGTPVPEAIATVLRPIDGRRTHTFFSYRVAESLARFGTFPDHPLLGGWTAAEIERVVVACDTTEWIPLLDEGLLPRNYAAVLARAETARVTLGRPVDEAVLERLVARTAEVLAEHPEGYLDDSNARVGRYDIYSADVYLFTEPLAGRLGPVWEHGARSALALVARVGATDGSAVPWGRSTGVLGVCLTVELAALGLAHGLLPPDPLDDADAPGAWLARAARAVDRFDDWISGGLVTAHTRRSPYGYRGPERWLQLTLDALGKLAASVVPLASAAVPVEPARSTAAAYPVRDELVAFEAGRAGVWTYRSEHLAFVLPVVGASLADYLPAPRNPGTFEVPVDAPLPIAVPAVWAGARRHAPGGRAEVLEHAAGRLRVVHQGFPEVGHLDPAADVPVLDARRDATYRVDGRTLHVDEHLSFAEVPGAVTLSVAETRDRPLRVDLHADGEHAVAVIPTDGMKEWRSFWAELPRVHQLDVHPAREIRLRWSVTPKLRVATTTPDHHYHRALYDPLGDDVFDVAFPFDLIGDGPRTRRALRRLDWFHLHWPEWLTAPDPRRHAAFATELAREDVGVVWTQHNLVPHNKDATTYDAIYEVWAQRADVVLHHSQWGMEQVRARYSFRDDARHVVLPHLHWGALAARAVPVAERARVRAEVEAELGLRPSATRLGVVGAPRAEKDVQLVLDAFHACGRDDLELLVCSLGPETVPDDPRIVALPYVVEPRDVYDRRLAALDAVILPFAPAGMLTTGTVGDLVAFGLPALVSTWPYLAEALGGAGLRYGSSAADLTAALDDLDDAALARAAAASAALQPELAPAHLAPRLLAALDAAPVGATRR